MLGVFLMNSVTTTVLKRLTQDKNQWFYPAREGADGPIIYKLLMQYGLQFTRYGIEATKKKLQGLNASTFGNDLLLFLQEYMALSSEIIAQGGTIEDDLHHTFISLETVVTPNAFVRFIEDIKSRWEQNLSNNLTADELRLAAETRFTHLKESGKWTKSKPVANKPEEEASDQKFLALVAAVKELAKAKDGNEQRTGGKGGNDKWKYEEPKDTKTIKKEVAGKTYWWCTGKNGENHKKMWCRHEPNTCNGTRPEKKGTPAAAAPAAAAPADESKPVARLKANKSITAALAALDEALKPKADTGYASDDSDFQ
jgi:hypothetical protein